MNHCSKLTEYLIDIQNIRLGEKQTKKKKNGKILVQHYDIKKYQFFFEYKKNPRQYETKPS